MCILERGYIECDAYICVYHDITTQPTHRETVLCVEMMRAVKYENLALLQGWQDEVTRWRSMSHGNISTQ